MTQDMRGLFFIVQGQYRHNLGPSFQNPVTESVNWCGGYDPTNPNTKKWFMLFDWATLTCHCAASDLDYVVGGVERVIIKYKTKERLVNTIKGMSFGVSSKSTKVLDEHLGQLYGQHFASLIKAAEDRAYAVVKEQDPAVRARKKLHRKVSAPVEMTTQRPQEVSVVTPAKKRGLRPKKRNTTIEYE